MRELNQKRYKELLGTISGIRNEVNDDHIRLLLDNCYSLTIESLELHNDLLDKYIIYVKNGISEQDKCIHESEILLERADNINKDDLVAIGLLQFEFTMKISIDDIKDSVNNFSYEYYTSMVNAATQSLFETYEGITESKSKLFLKLLGNELAKLDPVGKSVDIGKKVIDINAIEAIEIRAADSALLKWKSYYRELYKWCSNCNLFVVVLNSVIKHQDSKK